MKTIARGFGTWLLVSMLGGGALAKEPARVMIEANPADFPYMKVIANIRTQTGEPITGIKQWETEIFEDGHLVDVTDITERKLEKIEPIDVVFVFDTTGSMGAEIRAVRDNILEFADVLKTTGMDYRLGLVTFGDDIRVVEAPMTDVAKFKDLIAKQKARGGGDTPENALDATHKMTEFEYRADAKVVGILITDAPFHSANKITKLHPAMVIQALLDKKIALYTLAPNLHEYLWMAAETGGVWHDPTQKFSDLVNQLAASLTAQYVIEYGAHNRTADSSKREVKLSLKHAMYEGSATSHYLSPGDVQASSVLAKKRSKKAFTKNVTDGNKATAWFEASPDDGIGEWVKVTFPLPKVVKKVGIIGGYPKSKKLFTQNNRLKTVTLVLSNGHTQEITLEDKEEMQYFDIASDARTVSVKVVIGSVYPGSKYHDTCIAELDIQ